MVCAVSAGGRVKFSQVAAPCSEWECKEHGSVCYAFVKSLAITKACATWSRWLRLYLFGSLHCLGV